MDATRPARALHVAGVGSDRLLEQRAVCRVRIHALTSPVFYRRRVGPDLPRVLSRRRRDLQGARTRPARAGDRVKTFTRADLPRLVDRSTLPGIDVGEVRALREWIRREGAKFDELRFEVRVGVGVQLEGDYTEKFLADWRQRTKMRLDLVAYNPPNQFTLIEAKLHWTNEAVWQLLAYRDQFVIEYPGADVRLVGVAEAYTANAGLLASDQGIRVHVYGFSDLPQAPAERVEKI